VERDDRPPVATFYSPAAFGVGESVRLSDAASHHARVKRLEAGDRVQVTDGRGLLGHGVLETLDKRGAAVRVESVVPSAPLSEIHVRVPVGDRDRMLLLAEKVTELGIASWQAVRFRRSQSVSPRGEGPAFGEKVQARMISALEQSGGAWLPARLPDCAVEGIEADRDALRVLLDRDGAPLIHLAAARSTVLLFGPEGGLEPAEREMLIAGGWQRACLADNTLRFETAGIAAVAVVRAADLASTRPTNS
jgi:16S rRNA (uracil1498-N3)-methyltransferase